MRWKCRPRLLACVMVEVFDFPHLGGYPGLVGLTRVLLHDGNCVGFPPQCAISPIYQATDYDIDLLLDGRLGVLRSSFTLIWRKFSSEWKLVEVVEATEALRKMAMVDQVAPSWFPRVALETSQCRVSCDPRAFPSIVPQRSCNSLHIGASLGRSSEVTRSRIRKT
ncbi:hypothetical protein BHE74_00028121 [Ensete ventricosum]|nr:hypothetical protein GW17_00043295 [Ensete ventricosum]RWW64629.1 hypothetical protein BHE74_00028121 [Ensete ventricosum]RZS11975.1 hypothetical protein BHM03_00043354 [Ensete ventricosum]